ncbi:hypothetical protein ACHAXR_012715 [Thalassiosira sp. AJA248-18]
MISTASPAPPALHTYPIFMATMATSPTTIISSARSSLRARSCSSWASRRKPISAVPSASAPVPNDSRFSRSLASSASKNHDTANSKNPNVGIGQNTNANQGEVDKFSSFASHWWDSRSNPLVGMNPIRVKFIREVADHFQAPPEGTNSDVSLPLQNKRILDIGCGGGLLTESLSRLGGSLVVGVDASPKVVEVAKMHSFHDNNRLTSEQLDTSSTVSAKGNIRYIGGKTVEELASHWLLERETEQTSLSKTNQSHNHDLFDIVTALEVIEHVPNPTSLLRAATTLLKPDGILFVSTINRTMKSYGLAIIAAEYITRKVPVGTHDWNQFWSPAEVGQMVCSDVRGTPPVNALSNSSMKQIALSGMVIEPPYLNMQWYLDPLDVDVNWIGAYQKQTSTA